MAQGSFAATQALCPSFPKLLKSSVATTGHKIVLVARKAMEQAGATGIVHGRTINASRFPRRSPVATTGHTLVLAARKAMEQAGATGIVHGRTVNASRMSRSSGRTASSMGMGALST
jgi:DhnA family fructose-bisphosphate aldolase class Ia